MKISFIDSINKYMNHVKVNNAKDTYKAYGYHMNTIIKYITTEKIEFLDDFTRIDLEKMILQFKQTCKNKTINKRVLLLKRVFKYSNIMNNDVLSYRKLRESIIHYDRFSEDELKRIMNYTNTLDSSNPYQLTRMIIVLLLIETGVRQSELLNIEIKNINIESNYIKLTSTKTKKEGYVFFTYASKSLLKEYIEFYPERKFLLWNYISYKRFTYRNLRAYMDTLIKKCNLKKCHPHMFRHTMATMFLENGGNLVHLQEILRHENIETTRMYIHMTTKITQDNYNKYNVLGNLFSK